MAKRSNHYEAAFEHYLRSERIPYVAVNEQRRALSINGSLKNVDFILSPDVAPGAPDLRWLVDVKGRRFPSGRRNKQYWRNWAPAEELDSLKRWSQKFGPQFDAAFVFAFHLVGDHSPTPPEQIHYFRNEPYAFVAAPICDYCAAAQTLSRSWGTVTVPTKKFRQIARPIHELLLSEEPICQEVGAQATLV